MARTIGPDEFGQFRKKRRSLGRFFWRFNDGDPVAGNAGGQAVVPDVEPENGGENRSYGDMAKATVDEPVDSPPVPGASAVQRTPADPNQAVGTAAPRAGQTPPTAPTENQWQSIREAAEAQGFQFDTTVTDDRTALNFLLRQASAPRQASIHEQLGRQLAPHATGIQSYLQQQSQPQQPTRQPWEAPEFDERWSGLVEQDPGTGLFTAKPGVPHEIATKVNAFVEWKRGYDRNPASVINGMVEARAKAVATDTFREQFAAQQREATISTIVNENSQWLYQVNEGGQRVVNYQGQFVPTPVGAAYLSQIQSLQAAGVTDPRQQDTLAKQLVRGQYAQAYQAQQLAETGQATNPLTRQAFAAPNVNPLQAQPRTARKANPAATEPSEAGVSLAERIRRDLLAEGVTDQDVFNSAAR